MTDTPPIRPSPVLRPLLVLLIVSGLAAAWMIATVGGDADNASPAIANAGPVSAADCIRLTERPGDPFTSEEVERAAARRLEACRLARAEHPADMAVATAYARALPIDQRVTIVALLREAAQQDHADAHYWLYEHYRSWERRRGPQALLTRADAARHLRRAAELGHPAATFTYAIMLERGDIVKRDLRQAAEWAARAMENPPPEISRGSIQVMVARLLAASADSSERSQGLAMLERLAETRIYNARTELARAIRAADPPRARALLEEALRADPGGATVALADMLIHGEGGPADLKRAVRMLSAPTDVSLVKAQLGRLYAAGLGVPQDFAKAAELMSRGAIWDIGLRLEVAQLLTEHPEVTLAHHDILLGDLEADADKDEPGARAALAALRLSAHPQFRDVEQGCRMLRETPERGAARDAASAGCPAP